MLNVCFLDFLLLEDKRFMAGDETISAKFLARTFACPL